MLYLSCASPQGPGQVPLSNLDSRQGPEDPQAFKGAQLFFEGLAHQAGQLGVAVDVLAVGQSAVNVPLLGPLTQKTGGTLITHQRKAHPYCVVNIAVNPSNVQTLPLMGCSVFSGGCWSQSMQCLAQHNLSMSHPHQRLMYGASPKCGGHVQTTSWCND